MPKSAAGVPILGFISPMVQARPRVALLTCLGQQVAEHPPAPDGARPPIDLPPSRSPVHLHGCHVAPWRPAGRTQSRWSMVSDLGSAHLTKRDEHGKIQTEKLKGAGQQISCGCTPQAGRGWGMGRVEADQRGTPPRRLFGSAHRADAGEELGQAAGQSRSLGIPRICLVHAVKGCAGRVRPSYKCRARTVSWF